MQLVMIIINRIELTDSLIEELHMSGFSGVTVLESKGMPRGVVNQTSSLNNLLNPDDNDSSTILVVAKEDQIPVISKTVNKITGGLEKPDTGVILALPLSYTENI